LGTKTTECSNRPAWDLIMGWGSGGVGSEKSSRERNPNSQEIFSMSRGAGPGDPKKIPTGGN